MKIDPSTYAVVTEDKILGFFGRYRFLSNFHPCPVAIHGVTFPSAENAYQAMKTYDPSRDEFNPAFDFVNISISKSRKLGQEVPLPADWVKGRRDEAMERVIAAKFTQNPDLKQLLIDTHPKHLEELNHWSDSYWGVDCKTFLGENKLGKILMFGRNVFVAKESWYPCQAL